MEQINGKCCKIKTYECKNKHKWIYGNAEIIT